MHKGPGMRTARTQAESIGTNPAGFTEGVDMEGDAARAGYPSMPDIAVDQYREQAPSITATPPVDGGESPFKLGGGK